jgi:hypothetical protein
MDEPRMHITFDATYDWDLLHLIAEVAKVNAQPKTCMITFKRM